MPSNLKAILVIFLALLVYVKISPPAFFCAACFFIVCSAVFGLLCAIQYAGEPLWPGNPDAWFLRPLKFGKEEEG
jgi:hypothetical protein